MRVGDKITMTAGKWSCVYLVTESRTIGITLRRVMKAKTKADFNRFNDTIVMTIGANFVLKNQSFNQSN